MSKFERKYPQVVDDSRSRAKQMIGDRLVINEKQIPTAAQREQFTEFIATGMFSRVDNHTLQFVYFGRVCELLLNPGWFRFQQVPRPENDKHRTEPYKEVSFAMERWLVYLFREADGWSDPTGKSWMIEADANVESVWLPEAVEGNSDSV